MNIYKTNLSSAVVKHFSTFVELTFNSYLHLPRFLRVCCLVSDDDRTDYKFLIAI